MKQKISGYVNITLPNKNTEIIRIDGEIAYRQKDGNIYPFVITNCPICGKKNFLRIIFDDERDNIFPRSVPKRKKCIHFSKNCLSEFFFTDFTTDEIAEQMGWNMIWNGFPGNYTAQFYEKRKKFLYKKKYINS